MLICLIGQSKIKQILPAINISNALIIISDLMFMVLFSISKMTLIMVCTINLKQLFGKKDIKEYKHCLFYWFIFASRL